MANNKEAVTVKIGVYSGLPNPEMILTDEQASQLADLINSTIGKELIHPPAQPKLGEFYGFLIELPEKITRQLQLPGQMTLFAGAVMVVKKEETSYWRDVAGIERFLLRLAYRNGYGDVLKRLNVNEPG
jgi:hypothetical protein